MAGTTIVSIMLTNITSHPVLRQNAVSEIPAFVRHLHFMIFHRLSCLDFDVMFVSMTDVTGN